MIENAKNLGFQFPYLFDESQDVAKAYKAACTPDFYIFNKNLDCVYRGQFDDSRPGNNIPVTGSDIREALNAISFESKKSLKSRNQALAAISNGNNYISSSLIILPLIYALTTSLLIRKSKSVFLDISTTESDSLYLKILRL